MKPLAVLTLMIATVVAMPNQSKAEEEAVPLTGATILASTDVLAPEMTAGDRSEHMATLLSLLGTAPALIAAPATFRDDDTAAAPLLLVGSLLIGPSLGHFYAGCPGRAALGIGLRAAAIAGVAGAVSVSWSSDSPGGDALGVVSLMLFAGSAIYDITTASKSARMHNERINARRLKVGVLPPTGSHPTQIVASMSF